MEITISTEKETERVLKLLCPLSFCFLIFYWSTFVLLDRQTDWQM